MVSEMTPNENVNNIKNNRYPTIKNGWEKDDKAENNKTICLNSCI